MSERIRFVTRLEEGESISELAREFGISTKTAHKFWSRWKAEGIEGLRERSHAVERIPHKTSPEVVDLIVAARQAHPSWGARKLKELLAKTHPGVRTPSSHTMQCWLKAKGLITPRRPRRRALRPPATPLTKATAPNDVWATDLQGAIPSRKRRALLSSTACSASTACRASFAATTERRSRHAALGD